MSPFEIAGSNTDTDFITRPVSLSRGPSIGAAQSWRKAESWKALDALGRRALFEQALDTLWLAFQPIVSLSHPDEPAFAFEALARNGEVLVSDPRDLLALAVSIGMVGDLGRVVHARAAEALRRDPDLTLFVNVDVEELMGSLGDDQDALSEFASRVVLEVTERAPISELPEVRQRSSALRDQGYRFAIDDLGGGYAGLSSLALMDPQFVKIDQALIRDVDTQPIKRKIVGSLAALARQLGIGCIVEGVETEGERDTLLALECDLMQGYLFGRPGPL
ncbi:MAG: EAL domain-containing protein [Vicinamibacteria bacterium]|nr:EAL domain-containing protein [Vicinamibacteria bacterium]